MNRCTRGGTNLPRSERMVDLSMLPSVAFALEMMLDVFVEGGAV